MGRTTCQGTEVPPLDRRESRDLGWGAVVQDAAGDEAHPPAAAADGADAQVDGLPEAAAGRHGYKAIQRSCIWGLIGFLCHRILQGSPTRGRSLNETDFNRGPPRHYGLASHSMNGRQPIQAAATWSRASTVRIAER